MHINKTKNYHLVIILGVLVISAVIIAILYLRQERPNALPQITDKPTAEQKEAGEAIKEKTIESDQGSDSNLPSSQQESSNGKRVTEVMFSALNQSNTQLQIRAIINEITTSGICTLTLQKGQEQIRRTTSVQASSNSSTCKGFDIPIAEISPGEWNLNLKFENEDTIGLANRKVIVK